MILNKKIAKYFVVVFFVAILGVQYVQAASASTYTLLEPLPGIDLDSKSASMKDSVELNEFVVYAFNLMIALSALAAVIMIIYGGFLYMSTDSWSGKSEGRRKVTNAIIGLLMVLCTYIIMKTVNPQLVMIPATLVEPIEEQYRVKTSFSAQFVAKLNKVSEEYERQAQEALSKARIARGNIEELQSRKDEIAAELSTLNQSEPKAEELKKELDQINEKLKVEEKNREYNVAQADLLQIVRAETHDTGSGVLEKESIVIRSQTLEDKYKKILQKMDEVGMKDVDKLVVLKELYVYERSLINLKLVAMNTIYRNGKYENVPYADEKRAYIKKTYKEAESQIQNTEYKMTLDSLANKILVEIKADSDAKTQAGSYMGN